MYLFAAAVWKAQPFASAMQSPPVAVILPDVSAEDLESGMLVLLISSYSLFACFELLCSCFLTVEFVCVVPLAGLI